MIITSTLQSPISEAPSDFNEKREHIHQFLLTFFDSIPPEEYKRCVTVSSHGVTDITLICRPLSFTKEPPSKFILKLSLPYLNASARINSIALQMLGLKAPFIFSWTNTSACHAKTVELAGEKIKSSPANKLVTYMEAFRGGDFGHLIETGALFKLNSEDWSKALSYFGKVAIFDLMLANSDRFYRFESVNIAPQFAKPFCNKGNIMLHIPLAGEDKRELKEIFCIDNASSNVLQPTRHNTFPPAKEKYLAKFLEALLYFSHPDNHKTFAALIYEGLMIPIRPAAETLSDEKKALFSNKDFLVEAISKGIEEGVEALKTVDEDTFIAQLKLPQDETDCNDTSILFCNKIIKHMSSCLKQLKGIPYG
jgi:hypothetical protein